MRYIPLPLWASLRWMLTCGWLVSTLYAQVPANPGYFSHYGGEWDNHWDYVYTGPVASRMATGRDGYTCFSVSEPMFGIHRLFVLDTNFQLAYAREAYIYQSTERFSVISGDREVWWVQMTGNDAHVSILDEQGSLLSQFMLPGLRVDAVLTDTLGKVFIFANAGSSGFALLRFTNATTLDWARWYPIAGGPQNINYCGDGRFYIHTPPGWLSLDGDGNPLRYQSHNWMGRAEAFADHGHVMARPGALPRTVEVVKTDSNMVVQWAKRIALSPAIYIYDSTVETLKYVAIPHTNEILVMASIRLDAYYTTNCNVISGQQYVRSIGIRGDGTIKRWNEVQSPSFKSLDVGMLNTNAFGEPLWLGYNQHCIFGAYSPNSLTAYREAMNGYALECVNWPSWPLATSTLTVPNGSSSSAAGLVYTPYTYTVAPDTLALTVPTLIQSGGGGCYPPCLKVANVVALGGGQVQFQDSVYGFHSVQYIFGDGTSGTTTDPLHAYPGPGPFTVTVIASNECGSDTSTLLVDPCNSAAMTAPLGGCVGLAATFTQATAYPPDSVEWLVNGVNQGVGNGFTFTPSAAGTYQIGIILHDYPCIDTAYQAFLVQSAPPLAAFSETYGSNNTVYFSNQSLNAYAYAWTFGDGGTSTAMHPSHAYANSGTYTICLTATNACGSTVTCDTISCVFAQAGFNFSVSGPTATFQDLSTNALSISWDFGDGSTGTGPAPVHTYGSSGNYTVCLYATGACGIDTLCQQVAIVTSNLHVFQTGYGALGVAEPRGQATNGQGKTCVVGKDNYGEFMLIVDSTGATQVLQHVPTFAYRLTDVCTTPAGDFLVVGSHAVSSQVQINGFWMVISPTGAVLAEGSIHSTAPVRFTDVKPARYGGYLLSGRTTMNNNNFGSGFYAKLDSNLQVEWSNASMDPAYAGFQAADSSYWVVQWHGSRWNIVHLYSTGTPFDNVEVQTSGNFYLGATAPADGHAVMDCNGVIYATAPIHENYLNNGGLTFSQGICSFNTSTQATLSKLYIHRNWGPTNLTPEYDFFPSDLILRSDGNLVSVGTYYTKGNPNVNRLREQFITIFTPALDATDIRLGNYNHQDKFRSVSFLPTQALLVSGTRNDTLTLTKVATDYFCPLPSTYHLDAYSPLPVTSWIQATPNSQPVGSVLPTSTQPTQRPGNAILYCSAPCVGTLVQASFTVAIVGNTVTLTSTSTPGALLTWSVQMPGCGSPTNQVSFSLPPCGSVSVSLTATNGCHTSTFTRLVGLQGSLAQPNSLPSLLNNTTICTPGPSTFTAPTGYLSYLWSTGDTTLTTTFTPPGNLALTVQGANGCYLTDTAVVTTGTLPLLTVSADTTICASDSASLLASGAFSSYVWSNGATTASTMAHAAGAYTVTATAPNGCTTTDTVQIFHFPGPTNLLGPDTAVTPGALVSLDAGPGFVQYLWSNGWPGQQILATTAGTYWVQVTDTLGCVTTDTILISNLNGSQQPTAPYAIALYPVPAQDIVHLDLVVPDLEVVAVEITDLHGKQLWSGELYCAPHGHAEIDVRHLASGYYWMRFRGTAGQAARRFGVVR